LVPGGSNLLPIPRVFTLSLMLAAAACVSSETKWDRPGAASTIVAREASDCSAIAWTGAEGLHPYGLGGPSLGMTADSGGMERRQRIHNERFASANRLTALCMENRGYKKVAADAR